MSTIHRLGIIGWVPVVIVEDYSVRCSQIDTQTASTRTEQEDKDIGPGLMSAIFDEFIYVKHTESATP